MPDNNKSAIASAKDNLKNGLSSPVAKILALVVFVTIVIFIALAMKMFSTNSEVSGGNASAGAYLTDEVKTDGGIPSGATVAAIEGQMNQRSLEALSRGESNLGSFVYEVHREPTLNVKDAFSEKPSPENRDLINRRAADFVATLRAKAAELARIENSNIRLAGGQVPSNPASASPSSSNSAIGVNGSASNPQTVALSHQPTLSADMVDASGRPRPYGLSIEDFNAIASQLSNVATQGSTYASLTDGVLTQGNQARINPASQPQSQSPSASQPSSNVVRAGSNNGTANIAGTNGTKTRLVAEAGAICPAVSKGAINTDFNISPFFEILECGDLTGVNVRGQIVMSPSDFVINFTDFFTTAKHNFSFANQPQGVSLNINGDGYPGVATNVNNHFISRLASAALLNLATTEKEFLNQRGTSTVTTGTSSSVSVEPMTDKEKNNMRVAGVIEGTMEVVTKDVQYGVNRKPTMEMPSGHVIGIQFNSNIEVVDVK